MRYAPSDEPEEDEPDSDPPSFPAAAGAWPAMALGIRRRAKGRATGGDYEAREPQTGHRPDNDGETVEEVK